MVIIMNKNKHAQLSLFVLLGVIALVLLGVSVYFITKPAAVVEEDKPVTIKTFVERCLQDTTLGGASLIAVQGGVIYDVDEMLDTAAIDIENKVAYGYYNDKNLVVTREIMQDEMSDYIENALPSCINNFEQFVGTTVEHGEITAETTITINKIIVTINYPIKYDQGASEETIDQFNAELDLRLGYIREIINEAVEAQIDDPFFIDYTMLGQMAQGLHEFKHSDVVIGGQQPISDSIDIIPVDEQNYLLAINDSGLLFLSAFEIKQNNAPLMEILEQFVVTEGEEFIFTVEVEDDDSEIEFSDDSGMFDISANGLIRFTPEIPGEYEVIITATDPHGNYDSRLVNFVVEEKQIGVTNDEVVLE